MPSLHEKCRYGKVFSVFVPKLRNKKKRCFALPQIAFAKGKKRKKAACKRKRLYGAGGGGRTRTPVKATDFESVKSADSITPARTFFIITQKIKDVLIKDLNTLLNNYIKVRKNKSSLDLMYNKRGFF